MKNSLIPALICAPLLLSACAQISKNTGPETSKNSCPETLNYSCPETPRNSSTRIFDNQHATGNELLDYALRYSQLSAEAQKKELAQLTQALAASKVNMNIRMKAALIYGLPASRFRDQAKSQLLLEDLLHDKAIDSDTKALATILQDFLDENAKLLQKNKDEQKRADGLQQKLDELKNIEKTMGERDQGVRK
jgi:hypothetical protein